MTKELSVRQFVILMAALYLGLGFVGIPSFYAKNAGLDCWLNYLLAQTIQLIILFCVIIMYYKNPDQSVYGLIQKSLGRVVAKILMSILCLFFVYKFSVGLGISYRFYSENIFEHANYLLFAVLVLPFLFFANAKGLRNMGRFGEITFGFSLVSLIAIILLGVYSAEMTNLGHILADGFSPLMKNLRFFLTSSGDTLVLIMMCGKLDRTKKFALKIIVAAILLIVLATVFLAVFIACYGNTAAFLVNAPGHIGELPLEMLGIGKIEWALILMYSVMSYMKLYLYLFAACTAIKYIFPLKSTNQIPCLVIVSLCALTPLFLPDFETISNALGLFALILLIPVLITPILLIVLSLTTKKPAGETLIENKADFEFNLGEKESPLENRKPVRAGIIKSRIREFIIKKSAVVLVLALCFISFGYFITGRNITNLLVVTGMGIDKTDSGYSLTLNVLSPTPPNSGNPSSGHITLSGEGKSIETALYDIQLRTDKTPNIDKCSVVVLGKSVYESNVLDVLSSLLSKNVQHNIIIVAASDTAKEVIEAKAPFDEFVASPLSSTLLSNKSSAYTALITMRKLMTSIYSKSSTGIIPVVRLTDLEGKPLEQEGEEGNASKEDEEGKESEDKSQEGGKKEGTLFDFSESIVIKDGKMSDQLTKEETAGYNFLYSKVKNFAVDIETDRIQASAIINISSRSVKHKIENNRAKLSAILKIKISSLQMQSNDRKDSYLESLNAEVSDEINEEVSNAIKAFLTSTLVKQHQDGDFLSLQNRFYSKYGNAWNESMLENFDFDIKVLC